MENTATKLDDLQRQMNEALAEYKQTGEEEQKRLAVQLNSLADIKAKEPTAKVGLFYAVLVAHHVDLQEDMKTTLDLLGQSLVNDDRQSIKSMSDAYLVELDLAKQLAEGIRKAFSDGH
jgi:hypothetical protein